MSHQLESTAFPTPSERADAVHGPAVALRWTGWLGVACSVGVIAYLLLRIAWLPSSGLFPRRDLNQENPAPRSESQARPKADPSSPRRPLPSGIVQADRLYGVCWLGVVGPCWAVLILASARQMQIRGHYESARMGCWLALLPLNPAWVVGVPVAIWGMRVLRREDVRQSFAAVAGKPGAAYAAAAAAGKGVSQPTKS